MRMRAKLSIFKKGMILISAPLLVQMFFFGLLLDNQHRIASAQRWSAHSKEVLTQSHTILRLLAEAENAMRRFVLARDPEQSGRYEEASRELEAGVKRLQSLVDDNPDQQRRASQVAARFADLQAWQAATTRLARAREKDKAVARLPDNAPTELVADIRRGMNDFIKEEDRLEEEREQALEESRKRLGGVLVVGTGVAFLVTVCMAFLFSRGISSRLATVAGNAERLALNQELNPPLTGSDEVARLDQAFRAMAAKLARSGASLRESDERFRLLMENVVDYALILLDTQGRIVSWNAGAQRLKGYRPAEILGKHFSCFYPPEANERGWPEEVLRTAAQQGRFEDEGWRVRKDGSKYWGNVVVTALRDEAGQLRGFAKLTRDLSERKQAEDAIRRLNEDLEIRIRQRTAELLESNRELSHKNQENETFVYSVSHDLRSPLVNLQGFSQELTMVGQELRALLDDERLAPALRERGLEIIDRDMAEATHFIQTAVQRLSNIIDALLRLSRAGRVEYQWQQVDVNALVERVVESMHATIVQRGATVSIGSLPAVRGDATAIEQLFANLIGNALQYLDATRTGMIEIGSSLPTGNGTADGLQTFFVRDNGLGIPESCLKKVFQAFQRAHPEVVQGEGMGLAIVRRIVERHRGKVWVESTVDEGSTFFVALPSTKATAREPGEHSDRELAAAVQA
jgi:PAS domain S-box-containing protein